MKRPIVLTAQPLPENHGRLIVEMFCVYRDISPEQVEIGENRDGSSLIFAARPAAEARAKKLGADWKSGSVWLLHKGSFDDGAPFRGLAAMRRAGRRHGFDL